MGLAIGKTYTVKGVGTFKVQKATVKGKAKSAVLIENGKETKRVNFGDPNMSNAPNTKRGDNYCSRSRSLNSHGFNANTLSRLDWNCKGSKSTDDAQDSLFADYRKTFDAGLMYDCAGGMVASWDGALSILESGECFEIAHAD